MNFGKSLSNKQNNIFATCAVFSKWWIEPYNISKYVSAFPWSIYGFEFQSRLIATFPKCILLFQLGIQIQVDWKTCCIIFHWRKLRAPWWFEEGGLIKYVHATVYQLASCKDDLHCFSNWMFCQGKMTLWRLVLISIGNPIILNAFLMFFLISSMCCSLRSHKTIKLSSQ